MAIIREHGQELGYLSCAHAAGVLHFSIASMPADEKTNPVKVSLLGFEAIVLVTKYLAHLIKQALGLGEIGDRVHRIKTMYKNTVWTHESQMSSGLAGQCQANRNPSPQVISSDKLGSQNIRRSTLRYAPSEERQHDKAYSE